MILLSLYNVFAVFIIIICILLLLIILVQNPQGGGLSSNFGSSNKNFTSPKITGGDISFMTGFKISSSLTLGYSYTSPIGEWTSSYNSNSHEIFIKIKTINSLKKSSEESNTEEIPKEKN